MDKVNQTFDATKDFTSDQNTATLVWKLRCALSAADLPCINKGSIATMITLMTSGETGEICDELTQRGWTDEHSQVSR